MKKIKLFIRKIIKSQFLLKHIIIFWIFPLISSLLITNKFINEWINSNFLGWIITIVWITWWLLLNFLAIILTSNSTILSALRDDYGSDKIYWKINIWTKKIPEIQKINYYDLMYYRIFFLIFLSLLFIVFYIFSFVGILDIIKYFDQSLLVFLNKYFDIAYIKDISHFWILKGILEFIYLYLLTLYFLLLIHLIYRLYYLFHKN